MFLTQNTKYSIVPIEIMGYLSDYLFDLEEVLLWTGDQRGRLRQLEHTQAA